MKLRSHVSTALAVSPFVASTTGGVHFLLTGAVFPDVDLLFKGRGHRMSLLHSVEIPLAGFLVLHRIAVPCVFGFPVGYLARCFFAGWLAHLAGDFVQGGVRSLFFKKKIGITGFTWDRYYNTPLGLLIDLSLLCLGLWGIYRTVLIGKNYLSLVSVAVAYRSGAAVNAFILLVSVAVALVVWSAM